MTKNLQKLFDEFIHECRFVNLRRPATIRGYQGAFGTFTKLMPQTTLESLTPAAFAEFCEKLQTRIRVIGPNMEKSGVKDSTVGTYQRKLYTFFKWLAKREHILKNPLDGIPRIKPRYEDIKILRKDEIDRIRAAVENRSCNLLQAKRDRAIISVLIFCGLRRGELLGLQVADVDLEKMVLTVRAETSKSKSIRKIPLNPQCVLYLEDYLKERRKVGRYKTAALFVSITRDRGISGDGINHWVNRLSVRSGVNFHLHQFRHTFACNLAKNGINAIELQKLLGHTDLRMTQVYVRSLNADDLRPLVSALTFENLA